MTNLPLTTTHLKQRHRARVGVIEFGGRAGRVAYLRGLCGVDIVKGYTRYEGLRGSFVIATADAVENMSKCAGFGVYSVRTEGPTRNESYSDAYYRSQARRMSTGGRILYFIVH